MPRGGQEEIAREPRAKRKARGSSGPYNLQQVGEVPSSSFMVLLAFLLALGSLAIHQASPIHQAILISLPACTAEHL